MARRPPETLDALLYAHGVPLGEVAAQSGVSLRALLLLRKGAIETPRVGTVAKLARFLGVEPSRVLAAVRASRAAGEG